MEITRITEVLATSTEDGLIFSHGSTQATSVQSHDGAVASRLRSDRPFHQPFGLCKGISRLPRQVGRLLVLALMTATTLFGQNSTAIFGGRVF